MNKNKILEKIPFIILPAVILLFMVCVAVASYALAEIMSDWITSTPDKNSECKKTDYWKEVEDCWNKGGEVYVSEIARKAVCKIDNPDIEIYSR